MHDEVLYAERVLRAGAQGYIMKEADDVAILEAVRRILRGDVYLSKEMEGRLIEIMVGKRTPSGGVRLANLSDRELEVFRMIGQGLGTRQIAEQLVLSIKTVETYRAKIKMKLHLDSGSQLVQQAVLWGHPELQSPSGAAVVGESLSQKTEAAR
jgi:DNA-binding NarL/FixJ family response regulator